MKDSSSRPNSSADRRRWPPWPLALVLTLAGVLDILDGLSGSLPALHQIRVLNGFREAMVAVGGTAQVILGLMLVVAGVGLLRRLRTAWALAILLLIVEIGINVAKAHLGFSVVLKVVVLGALLLVKRHFTCRSALSSLVFSFTSVFAILIYGVFGSYLLGNGFRPEIQDVSTAFYFTITTLSTVAFGDIVPVTTEARWFVIILIVVGLGVFASVIASVLGPKISEEFNRMFNPKEKFMELKDHVILVGEGIIASNTAKELKQRGVTFVQIVSAKSGTDDPGAQIIAGDATNDAVLQDAGIQHARMVIAAREDDGENAFIALGAKDLNPNVKVMAVASSALSMRRLKLVRADLVFSPAAVGGRLLADLVEGRRILPEFDDLLEGHAKKD